MAVKSNFVKKSLVLIMKSGQNNNGGDILKRLTLSNVKKGVSDENVYKLSTALKDILIYPIQGVNVSSIDEIINE